MDAGAIVALASVIVVVLIAVFGGIIRHLLSKNDRLAAENRSDRDRFEAKLEIAERTADTKQETIGELRRQVDKLEITAEIQRRFLDQLPKQLPPQSGGT